MAYSEKASDIYFRRNVKLIPQKSQYSFCISINLSQKWIIKGHYSVKNMRTTSKLQLIMYLLMLYLSVKFERNCCINVIDLKPEIDNLAGI